MIAIAMRKHEIISKLKENWTYEFFLELISNLKKNATTENIETGTKKKRTTNNFAEIWGLDKFDSKYEAIESNDELETSQRQTFIK